MTAVRLLLLVVVLAGCGNDPIRYEAVLSSGAAGRSTTAVAPDGSRAYFTWVERDTTGWNVWLSAWERGTDEPLAPIRVNGTPGNAAPHDQAPPQVGVDRDGRVVVVWINRMDIPGRRFPANDLFLAVSEDGGRSFGPERTVNSDAGGLPSGHTFHNLTPLPDGAMLVSWIDGRTREANPDSGAGSEIRVARVEDGGRTIRETAILDTSSCPCCRTTMAVAPSGRIHVAWRHEYETGERDIVTAHSDDGGETFSDIRPVHRDHWKIDACPHTGPALAVTPDGHVHAAWYTGAPGGAGLFHAVSTDGGNTFDAASPVLPGVPVAQAALTLRPDGRVLLLTEDRTREGISRWQAGRSAVTWQSVADGGVLPSAQAAGGLMAETWRRDGRIVARVEEWS